MQIEQLSKSYGAKTLFSRIDLKIPDGEKIAVIGQNGAGKTTLLNIICGLTESDSGRVMLGKNATLGYLPQEPNPSPKTTVLAECEAGAFRVSQLKHRLDLIVERLESDHTDALLTEYEEVETLFKSLSGYSLHAAATQILIGLGFKDSMLGMDPRELSGGWRMRLELAKIFLNRPDFLILDEPTNHLDLPSLVWVEKWLMQFPGTVLFVSHDQDLLNRLATYTMYVHAGRIDLYRGNFSDFLVQKEQKEQQIDAERKNLARRREDLERFVERFGAKATKASQAQSRIKMIARLKSIEEGLESDEPDQVVAYKLPEPPKGPKIMVSVKGLTIGYDPNRPLARSINLEIEKGQRIAVIGANGIGKSTFLKTLVNLIPKLNGEAIFFQRVEPAYFAQEQSEVLSLDDDLMTNVLSSAPQATPQLARSLLGALMFRNDDVYKKATVLSGGEKNKLGMACLLAKRANLLILDEPTNHLDMMSVEALIAALSQYEGTILFVSHNRNFINALATHVFVMLDDGRSELFLGDLTDYQRAAESRGFPNVLQETDTPKTAPKAEVAVSSADRGEKNFKEMKAERARLEKLLQKLETEQSAADNKLAELERKTLRLKPDDYLEYQKINQAIAETVQAKVVSENLWLESCAALEELTTKMKKLGRS